MGLADVVAVLRADTSQFTMALGKANAEMGKLSTSGASNMEKLASVGKAAFLAVGAAAVAVGVASVDLAAKFQTTTASIAANGGISVKAAQAIGQAFLDTGGSTIYSGQQIAAAFAAVAGQVKMLNGGVLTASAAMTVMKASMDLAEASGTDLSSATADVTKVLQAFGLGVKSSPLVANVLFNAARDTGQSVDTLTGALTRARSQMGSSAPSIGDLSGLLLDLTQHGETGRQAMSALGSAFTGIISPTAAVTKAQQDAGLAFVGLNGALLPIGQIIGELAPKIDTMGNAQATAYLKTLGFGSASSKLVDTIKAGPAAFEKDEKAVSKAGSAHDAAAKQSKTMAHQLDVMKASAEDLAVKIGQKLIPIIESVVKVIEKVVSWFEKHKMAAAALAVVIGGVLLAATVLWTISLFAAGGALAFLMSPITLIVAGVALLVAGIVLLATHWSQVWGDVKRIAGDAWHFLYDNVFEPLVGFFTGLPGKITTALSNVLTTITTPFITAATWIYNNVIQPVVTFFTALPGQIVSGLGDVVTTIWSGLTTAGRWITTNVITPVVTLFTGLPAKIVTALGDIVTTIWAGLTTAGTWIDTNVIQPVVAFFKGLPSKIVTVLGNFIDTIFVGLKSGADWLDTNVWTPVSTFFKALPGKIVTALGDLSKLLFDVGKKIIGGLLDGLKAAWHDVTGWLGNVGGWISNLKGPIEKDAVLLVPHGIAIMQGLADGLQKGFTGKVAPLVQGMAATLAGQSFGATASLATTKSNSVTSSLASLDAGGIQPLGSASTGGGITYSPVQQVMVNGSGLSAADLTVAIKVAFEQHDAELIRTLTAA